MDELLKAKPSQLSDERRALFSLMDRFSVSIDRYKRQYASTKDKMNSDLQQRRDDKADTLKRLKEKHSSERNSINNGHNSVVKSLESQKNALRKESEEKIRQEEEKLSSLEKNVQTTLTNRYNENQYNLKRYNETRDQVKQILEDVDVMLGNNLFGKSILKSVVKTFDRPDVAFESEIDAKYAVDKKIIDYAEEDYRNIKQISESFFRRIFQKGKRNRFIKDLSDMDYTAMESIRWFEAVYESEDKERKSDGEKKLSKARKDCKNNKEAIINNKNERLKVLNDKSDKENTDYRNNLAETERRQKEEYESTEKHYDDEIREAQENWNNELQRCNDEFATRMEEDYPVKRMNAWINQFWYHPRNVEDYDKIDYMQLNTLIGMAVVDISDWYDGDTADVVRDVLYKYICLFGRNKEQADKGFCEKKLLLPYTISIEEGDSLILNYDDASEDRAKNVLNAVGMRLLRSVPACQMRFLLVDAKGIGSFGSLLSLDPAQFNTNPSEPTVKSIAIGDGVQVHSTDTDIKSQISAIKVTMDDLSKQLTNYGSIREFNERNPLSKQIYRPLLMMNFPLGLGLNELITLNAMSEDCSKWGFSMVIAQPDKANDYNNKPEITSAVEELERGILTLKMRRDAKYLIAEKTHSIMESEAAIYLYGIPETNKIPGISRQIREESVEASRILIHFTEAEGICPEKSSWFTKKSTDGIVVPVGYIEGGEVFNLQFDDKHVHAIIMGNTGSGKTNLLHVLMTNTMLNYPPEEVMFYLIDFKYGLDFRMYTQYNLPNFRAISVNNDPEFALAMLQNLEKEQEYRSTRMGDRYQKLSDYNRDNPNNRLNRIILIVDELYELAKQASDDIQKSILAKIDTFAHQTRAFGIHLIVCGQDLDKIDRFETIKNQCTTRLALHCDDEQVKLLMDEDGVNRMHNIDSNDLGACVFSLSNGKKPQIEHTTYIGAAEQKTVLEDIHKHYLESQILTNVKVLLTKVSDNPNHLIQMFVSQGHLADLPNNRLIVGEPISMDRELILCPSGNLWIAGGTGGKKPDESIVAGYSIMFFAALSLMLAKIKDNMLDIWCSNCSDNPLRDIDEEEKDLFGQLTSTHENLFVYNKGDNFSQVLGKLLDELEDRKSGIKDSAKAIWWLLVRPEMIGDFSGNDVIDLKELLQNGPKYNIHTIVWNADIKNAQKLQIGSNMFNERICLDMNSDDSKTVNGRELKPEPEGYKAVLIGNNTMRFRVYDLPDGGWMNSLFDRLNALEEE